MNSKDKDRFSPGNEVGCIIVTAPRKMENLRDGNVMGRKLHLQEKAHHRNRE